MKYFSWTRLNTIFLTGIYDKVFAYFIGTLGLVVGLRLKLIGEGDKLIARIDGRLLLVAGILFLVAGLMWKLAEISMYFTVPTDISENTSIAKYLESRKKSTIDEDHYKQVYDETVDYWNNLDQGKETIRKSICSGLAFALFLLFLSVAALVSSSWHLLISLVAETLRPG